MQFQPQLNSDQFILHCHSSFNNQFENQLKRTKLSTQLQINLLNHLYGFKIIIYSIFQRGNLMFCFNMNSFQIYESSFSPIYVLLKELMGIDRYYFRIYLSDAQEVFIFIISTSIRYLWNSIPNCCNHKYFLRFFCLLPRAQMHV